MNTKDSKRMSDNKTQADAHAGAVCELRTSVDMTGITLLTLTPESTVSDYRAAMALANREASQHLGEYMLLSWYDRDRDFESPQHSSECHLDSAVPGYVDYGVSHGATLQVDIEQGRFVFFYMPVTA